MYTSNNKNSDDYNDLSLQLPAVVIFQYDNDHYDLDSDNDSIPSLVSYDSVVSTEFKPSAENNDNVNGLEKENDDNDNGLENEIVHTKG